MSKRQAERDVKSGANAPVVPNPGKSRAEGQDIEQKVEQKKKRKSIPKEKKEAILKLREKGLTQREIADKAKVSIMTVNKYLKTLQQEKPAEDVNQQTEPIQTEQHPPLVKVPDPKAFDAIGDTGVLYQLAALLGVKTARGVSPARRLTSPPWGACAQISAHLPLTSRRVEMAQIKEIMAGVV